jgi:hypothetical protein
MSKRDDSYGSVRSRTDHRRGRRGDAEGSSGGASLWAGLVEALYFGATTDGERGAAGAAVERLKAKLDETSRRDPPSR